MYVQGANCQSVQLYKSMTEDPNFQKPHAWTEPNFSLDVYDVVFLPGGHDKGVRQVIDSPVVHKLLAAYFPQTKKPSRKTVVAVCHGVMALARARNSDGNSVLHDVHTTALPGFMEQSIFWATRAFLGDYYKTYGAGSESVEQDVKSHLGNPKIQYHNSLSMGPFIHEDENYNYISGRFPPDAQLLAEKTIALVQRNALL
ncbi:MAG: hypothetical protein M1834_005397 [Cirrosporium novae-zelandiae]|nr:MAG: hypothetical protein M1834_005397 [Cirrosporium novae-zelandiae]